jgi:hypothetical protein
MTQKGAMSVRFASRFAFSAGVRQMSTRVESASFNENLGNSGRRVARQLSRRCSSTNEPGGKFTIRAVATRGRLMEWWRVARDRAGDDDRLHCHRHPSYDNEPS